MKKSQYSILTITFKKANAIIMRLYILNIKKIKRNKHLKNRYLYEQRRNEKQENRGGHQTSLNITGFDFEIVKVFYINEKTNNLVFKIFNVS